MLFISNIGAMEVFVILILAVLIFGPKKLPELGRSLGKGLREFRKGTSGLMDSLNEPDPPRPQPNAAPAPQLAAAPKPAEPAPAPAPAQAAAPPKPAQSSEGMVIDLENEGKAKE